MKRSIGFGIVVLIIATMAFGPASAQDNSQATISALQTQVADLQATVDARGEKINAQRTQIAELKTTPTSDGDSAAGSGAAALPTVNPNAPKGTRENPTPLGTPVQIGKWVITVLSTVPNGTDLVLAENQFNDLPADGRQFFIVRVRAEYKGSDSDTLPYSVSFSAVGASGVAYQGFEDYCGVIPDEISSSEVFAGAVIEGNVCWSVKSDDADSLVMFGDELFSFDDDSRVYFAVR